MGSNKKMKPSALNGYTTLRLRIVKVRGPQERLPSSVTMSACGRFMRIRIDSPEWCVLKLSSPDDDIVFQTAFGDTSFKCRDIDGRKRLDIGHGISFLVEGYWVVSGPDLSVVETQIPAVLSQTRHCQISFMSTGGSGDYKLPRDEFRIISGETEDGWIGKFGRCIADGGDVLAEQDYGCGPVANALKWIMEKDAEAQAHAASLRIEETTKGRIRYIPSARMRWDVSMTAMSPGNPAVSPDLEGTIRAVEMSANLTKAYMV